MNSYAVSYEKRALTYDIIRIEYEIGVTNMRIDGRNPKAVRPIKITRHFTAYAEGSVLIEFGNTKVLCNATIEEKVPRFMKGEGRGWVTAEYSLLPRATQTRNSREAAKGKQTGRTVSVVHYVLWLILKHSVKKLSPLTVMYCRLTAVPVRRQSPALL